MQEDITFYTTGCSKCAILKKKLDASGIDYRTCTNVDEMQALGLSEAPALMVGSHLLGFGEAVHWVNTHASQEE